MRLWRQVALIVLVFALCGCWMRAAKTGVDAMPVPANPLIIHRSKVGIHDVGVRSLDKRMGVTFADGATGHLILYTDGTQVFLLDESLSYGTFDFIMGQLIIGDEIRAIPEKLGTGDWRLPTEDDLGLLEASCSLFGVREEPPDVCVFGSWASADTNDDVVPVVRPGGIIDHMLCTAKVGVMYIQDPKVSEEP